MGNGANKPLVERVVCCQMYKSTHRKNRNYNPTCV